MLPSILNSLEKFVDLMELLMCLSNRFRSWALLLISETEVTPVLIVISKETKLAPSSVGCGVGAEVGCGDIVGTRVIVGIDVGARVGTEDGIGEGTGVGGTLIVKLLGVLA